MHPDASQAAEELYEALVPILGSDDEQGVEALKRENLSTNPSAKLAATGLSRAGATEAVRVVDAAGSPAGIGVSTYFTTTGSGSGNRIGWLATLQAGRTYTFSVYVKATALTGGALVIGGIRKTDGTVLVTSAPTIAAVTGAWVRLVATYTPTETAEYLFTTSQNGTGTSAWAFTGALIEEAPTAGSYFDGDFAGCEWLGTQDASISRLRAVDTTWPGLRLCMALTSGNVDFLHEILTDSEVAAGWEILFDPERCPVVALPFLAQFPGAILRPDMTTDAKRAAIKSPQSFRSGSVPAIEEIVKRRLTGEKIVNITERYTASAWRIQVSTNAAETPEEAATIEDLKRYAKPIGIVLFFNGAVAWTWGEIAVEVATYPTWNKIAEAFPTWNALISHVP